MKKILAALAAIAIALVGVILTPSMALADGTLSVTITSAGAVPVPNAVIEFQQENSKRWFYTDAAGTVNDTIPNGTYRVLISAPGLAPEYYDDSYNITGAQDVVVTDGSNLVINAQLAVESTISGTITDYNNQPVAGAQVFAYSENNGWSDYDPARDITAADGTYSIGELAPGNYKVWVSTSESDDLANEWHADQLVIADAAVVTIGSTGIDVPVDVQLSEGGTIDGVISNTIGSPVALDVKATGAGQDYPSYDSAWTTGEYSFTGLAADTYEISTVDYLEFFEPTVAGPVTVSAGSSATRNLVVTPVLPPEDDFSEERAPLTGPTTVEAGKTYTWTLDVQDPSDVYVILYSDPVFLGAAPIVGSSASITLTIPASTTAGAHKFTYSTYDDEGIFDDVSRVFFPITVTAASGAAGPGAAALPATGADANLPIGIAIMLLLAGVGAIHVQRRFAPAK